MTTPTVISALFTPEEWLTANALWETHKRDGVESAVDCTTMGDTLFYGARYLQEHGHEFSTFTITDDGDVQANADAQPQGGAPALIGVGHERMFEVAELWIRTNMPHLEADLDLVQNRLEEIRGDAN